MLNQEDAMGSTAMMFKALADENRLLLLRLLLRRNQACHCFRHFGAGDQFNRISNGIKQCGIILGQIFHVCHLKFCATKYNASL